MGRPQILPSTELIIRWRDEGMTHQQMADRANRENQAAFGKDYPTVGRSAVAVALHKAGVTGKGYGRTRYDVEIPWVVRKEHRHKSEHNVLRYWGRERAGEPLTKAQKRDLDNFVANKLTPGDLVITYHQYLGWRLVKRRRGIDDGLIRWTDKQLTGQ